MLLVSTRSPRSGESGSFLIIGAIITFAGLTLGALVIDILRVEQVGRSLQRAADAAALAGTIHLVPDNVPGEISLGELTGWQRAKRGSFSALRANPIEGDSGEIQQPGTFGTGGGNSDPFENPDDSNYKYTEYTFPNLFIRIERGRWVEPCTPNAQFESLEDPGDAAALPPSQATAVRVTLRLLSLPTTIARFFGFERFTLIERVATAAPEGCSP